MTRIIKLKFTDDNDYADVLVAMRPHMAGVIIAQESSLDEIRAEAIAAICRAQSAPAKPTAAPGPLPDQATHRIFTDVTGA